MDGAHSAEIDASFARARETWPGVVLDRDAFARAIASADPAHASDLFLAVACAAGDARAIAHLERAFFPPLSRAIAHVARDAADRDEVLQRLRQKLLVAVAPQTPRVAEYGGRGPLGGFLRVAAVREALNWAREKKPDAAREEDVSLDELAPNDRASEPELALARAHHGKLLADALREAVAALSPDDRMLLKMCYLDGLEIEEIGKILGVHRSTASRALARTRKQVLDDTRRRVRERMRGSASEVESVLRLAQADLDISLNRAFS